MEKLILSGYPCAKVFKFSKDELDKIDFVLCKEPKETLESFYTRQITKPDVLCNGGFFALSTGNTVFTFVDEGKVVSMSSDLNEGIGIKKTGELVAGEYDSSYKDFISAYPVLIKDSQPVTSDIGKELNYNARRTILGYDKDYVYLVVVDSPGYAFNKCKKLLQSLAVTDAINLDGGGSTRVLVNGKCETDTSVSSRAVDNVVCFYLKKEETIKPVTTASGIYRVQTGAFASRTNAEKYRDMIRLLDDPINVGYKNAYVRIIDGLYKVQVGAFSNRNNAEKVVSDLATKGYKSFITSI